MTLRAVALVLALAGPVWAGPIWADPGAPVLALGGSVTEIVYLLGQGDRLVGRDTTSVYPAEARALPDVGYLRALSPEGVLSVGPGLIIAEADAGPPETVAALAAASVPLVLVPEALDAAGVAAKIRAVAGALGLPEEGAALADRVEAEITTVATAAAAEPVKRRAIFVLSVEGGRLLAAGEGTGAAAMLALAGAENALTGFHGYKPVSDEAVAAAAPEVVVMMARSGAHDIPAEELFALPALVASPAAAHGALIRLDGLYLLGFGPRTGQAVADLHRALYPAAGG